MNRTGLTVALAISAIVGVVFAIYPELDIQIARQFFAFGPINFGLRVSPVVSSLRDTALWVETALAAPAVVALVVKCILPRKKFLLPSRAVVFLLATLSLGPGLFVNVLTKDYWGRSRPVDIPEFGGNELFVPWWDPRGICPKNCSFVAGDASGAFWTLAPAALTPPAWRALAYTLSVAFGTGVGLLRIAAGAHFFSDVVFSGVFTFLIIWIVHGLIYRWARTRVSDEALEAAIERATMLVYSAISRLWVSLRLRSPSQTPKDKE
jgi:membrane-associated PAP2 superfamily phosphatase